MLLLLSLMFHPIRKKAFTLVEMLIVIVIIGILAAALIPRLLGAQAKARDTARVAQVKDISTAIEMYAASNDNTYPIADYSATTHKLAYTDAKPSDAIFGIQNVHAAGG